jgi:hypothetical protein
MILAIILIASTIRARINFSSEMIPGINGGYYPLLVRNLLEYGSIRYPDTPLIYWIQAFLSLIINIFNGSGFDHSVLMSSKIFDSIVPPLTCVPVFLFAKDHLRTQQKSRFFVLTISAFSVLYLGFLLVLSSEMQKNAAGLIWVACYILWINRFMIKRKRKDIWISLIFLILIALTHIGCFAVAFLFTLIYGITHFIGEGKRIRMKTLLIGFSAISLIILISFAILIKDPDRMLRVLSFYLNPLRIFESPYLFLLLSGQQVYFGFLFHNFLLINILSIAGLIIVLINHNKLVFIDFTFALSLAILSICLSSPLIGMEWALRYYLMAFLPIALMFVFVYKSLTGNVSKIAITSVFFLLTAFSVFFGITGKRSPSISSDAYKDLVELKTETHISPGDLIVARHGLEWWTGWVLRCRTGKEYCLRPEDWHKYPNIYLLRQKSGNNYPGQQGTGQFAEFPIPETAEKIISNRSFDLYRLIKPIEDQYYSGVLPLLQGTVISINDQELTVRSQGYRQKVTIGTSTKFMGIQNVNIEPGMRADIWGKRIPFSLKTHAEIIRVYQVY